MHSIAKALLVFFLPFILAKLVLLIKALCNWKDYVVFGRSHSRSELFSLFVLLAGTMYFAFGAMYPDEYYFAITKTPIDAPAFLIRNRFREYINQHEANDAHFAEMIRARRAAIGDSTDTAKLNQVYSTQVKLEKTFIELENLSHLLRNNEIRKQYLLYGPAALQCQVCDLKSPWQYALLTAPLIMKDYLLALFVIGLATTHKKKAKWRSVAIALCSLMVVYEAYEIAYSDSINIQLFDPSGENFETRLEQLAGVRIIALLILCTLTLLIDYAINDHPAVAKLKASLTSLETSTVRLQTARLARTAAMGDDTLRKHYETVQRKVEQEKQHLFNDPEYKRVQAELAHKYNMNAMLQKAEEAVKMVLDMHLKSE